MLLSVIIQMNFINLGMVNKVKTKHKWSENEVGMVLE